MINPVPPREMELLTPLVGKSMLELGNKRNASGTFKDFFESLGFHHVSVDLNGKDGALPLDLQEPLNLGRFDMVTNFGTTEHVLVQEPAWRNVIEATGQVLVSTTPTPGEWLKHGRWYPTITFYEHLAAKNAFKIERLFVSTAKPGRGLIFCRMHRVNNVDFVMPDLDMIYDNGDHGVGMAP